MSEGGWGREEATFYLGAGIARNGFSVHAELYLIQVYVPNNQVIKCKLCVCVHVRLRVCFKVTCLHVISESDGVPGNVIVIQTITDVTLNVYVA